MSILSNLQTKKLGLFELIAMGFDLYLKHFRSFFSLLCIVMPFSIILQIITLYIPSNSIFLILFWLFYILNIFVVIPIYSIVIAILTEGYILGENHHLNVNIAIRRALSRILALVSLNIKFGIIFFFRFLLLIVPGVIYLVNNGFFNLAFILRDQRGKAAFQYSRSLVKGNWWNVFLFNLLILITSFGLQMLINTIVSSIIASSPALVAIFSIALANLVGLGIGISGVLLFLNLDFQKR